MDVRTEKLWLIDQIVQITDERLISTLKNLMEFAAQLPKSAPTPVRQKDFWDDLTEGQKRQIEKSIRQLDGGEGMPHESVMAEFRKTYAYAK